MNVIKIKYLKVFALIWLISLIISAHAAEEVITEVETVGVNNRGVVFFNVSSTIEQPGCSGQQVVIPPESEIKDRVLSIVLSAKASSSKIALRTSGCYGGSPSIINNQDAGWVYIVE